MTKNQLIFCSINLNYPFFNYSKLTRSRANEMIVISCFNKAFQLNRIFSWQLRGVSRNFRKLVTWATKEERS